MDVDFTPWPATQADADAFPGRWVEEDTLGRVAVRLSDADHRRMLGQSRRSRKWIAVTDEHSGARIEVRPASCGLGCRCAAEFRMVDDGPCIICGAYGGDHDDGCMVGAVRVEVVAVTALILSALYVAAHVLYGFLTGALGGTVAP